MSHFRDHTSEVQFGRTIIGMPYSNGELGGPIWEAIFGRLIWGGLILEAVFERPHLEGHIRNTHFGGHI